MAGNAALASRAQTLFAALPRPASYGQTRFIEAAPFDFRFRNIALIAGALVGFALISEHVNMIAGIVFMVFCASFAGTGKYSVVRNLKVAAGLVAVALAFQKLLGFNLPLY